MEEMVGNIYDYVWSIPLVGLCLAAGLFYSILTRFVQVRLFGEMLRLLFRFGIMKLITFTESYGLSPLLSPTKKPSGIAELFKLNLIMMLNDLSNQYLKCSFKAFHLELLDN